MVKAGNVYLRIARAALEKWHPEIKEATRQKILEEGDYDYLENNYVFGHESISEGVISLRASLKQTAISLPRGFTDYVKYGGRFDVESIREEVESISSNEQAKIALTALSAIHDRWVRGNLKKFEDPGRYSKRYMFMPLPLIGFEAVRSDLVFLEEILREIGMKVTERDLYDAYTEAVVVFRHENRTSSRKGLIDWLMFHLKEYRAEDEYIVRLMQEHYEAAADVADQVIERLRGDGFMFLL